MVGTSGSARWTSATHRNAIGATAGPLSPPERPSGNAAGTALPTTTAVAPASWQDRAPSTIRETSGRSLASTGRSAGNSRRTAAMTLAE